MNNQGKATPMTEPVSATGAVPSASVVDRLRELLDEATPGPWPLASVRGVLRHGGGVYYTADPDYRILDVDAALIVALRNNADALLRVVEAARVVADYAAVATTDDERHLMPLIDLRNALTALDAAK